MTFEGRERRRLGLGEPQAGPEAERHMYEARQRHERKLGLRINWASVDAHCRGLICFGEDELAAYSRENRLETTGLGTMGMMYGSLKFLNLAQRLYPTTETEAFDSLTVSRRAAEKLLRDANANARMEPNFIRAIRQQPAQIAIQQMALMLSANLNFLQDCRVIVLSVKCAILLDRLDPRLPGSVLDFLSTACPGSEVKFFNDPIAEQSALNDQ